MRVDATRQGLTPPVAQERITQSHAAGKAWRRLALSMLKGRAGGTNTWPVGLALR